MQSQTKYLKKTRDKTTETICKILLKTLFRRIAKPTSLYIHTDANKQFNEEHFTSIKQHSRNINLWRFILKEYLKINNVGQYRPKNDVLNMRIESWLIQLGCHMLPLYKKLYKGRNMSTEGQNEMKW